jgi:hypothetical protein
VNATAHAQLEAFIDPYAPEVAALARDAFGRLRARLPGAKVLVYDNYNALAIGFGATGRTGEAFLSLALFPRWVSLFFLQGASLPDPRGVLRGGGRVARHVVLKSAADVDEAAIVELIDAAVAASPEPLGADGPGEIIIRSVSARQRPRRPS